MKTITRVSFFAIIGMVVLYACTNFPTPTPTVGPEGIVDADGSTASVGLTVVAVNGNSTFNTVGQVINYSYSVTNTGITPLPGPVTITDDKTTVPQCAAVNTVGNLNTNLDTGESVTCTSTYTINQADLTAGRVTSNATARVGNVDSNRVTTTVNMTVTATGALTLTVTANPTTYSAVGQTITFTYAIRNSGTTNLGPDQFKVSASLFPSFAAMNCDAAGKTLAPNDTISCTSPVYQITQNDMALTAITNTATASGGGVTSAAATGTVTKSTAPVPSGNYTKGSTIQHTVRKGEWLLQIARCYGIQDTNEAAFREILRVNPQIFNPNFIKPDTIVTVPNIGADGPIYGPPCVGYHVVQSGETWDTIKAKYNAKLDVLQEANRTLTFANGVCLKIPLNSALGSTAAQTALTACPGSTAPNPTTRDPIRITIASGQTTATVTNTVDSTSKVRFLLAATQGQTLTVKVTAAANEVSMGVIAANGTVLKAQDTTLTFTGTLPATGDTLIDIASVSGTTSKSFTLEVTVTSSTPQSLERVVDINTGINNSDPAYLAVFNNQLFFKATGANNAGAELWRYDATTKTPSMAKDIVPGTGGADPAFLATFNGALYFRANGDANGAELWRWNGSDAGRLTDINPGAGNANPAYMTVFSNALYFSARAGDTQGTELWKTDGTSPIFVADINTGPGDSNPAYLTVFNNALYFSAVSADGMGVELYKYDGTNQPSRVSDINPGVGNSNPSHLAVFNNALYFSANANDGAGIELWKYDGTNAPMRLFDINVGAGDSIPSFLTVFNGALYFSANGNDGSGTELWKYDGTNAPKRISDINTAGNANPSYLAVFNNELYFQAASNDGTGTELWKFKGP